jgi:hypothetical protein
LRISDSGLRIADCGLRQYIIVDGNVAYNETPSERSTAMTPEQLKQRPKKFGIRTVKVVEKLPPRRTAQTLANNYFAAVRRSARTIVLHAEFEAMRNFGQRLGFAKRKPMNRSIGWS